MMRRLRRINYRHWICAGITLGFLGLSVFCYTSQFERLVGGLSDFGTSIAYYFCRVFAIPIWFEPTLNALPELDAVLPALPADWDVFALKARLYWQSLLCGQTYGLFFAGAVINLRGLLMLALLLVVLIPIVWLLRRRAQKVVRIDDEHESKPLRAYKWTVAHTVTPVAAWVRGFIGFVRERRRWLIVWAVVWAYNLNLVTIALEVLAFLFYVVVSLDFAHIYVQVYKLSLDLGLTVSALPWYVWIVVLLPIYQTIRHHVGLNRQRRHECLNRRVRDALPLVTVLTGSMGTGKTTHLVDLALSFEVDWRQQSYLILLKQDLKFPCFPWIAFERDLCAGMDSRAVYNLASARAWVRSKRAVFESAPSWATCWGYDYNRYGLDHNDALKVEYLFDVLEIYAQAYLIYVMQSSLLVGNLSIRSDGQYISAGGLPMWDYDFFSRDPALIDAQSRHAHILDFDILRLGRKIAADNPIANSLEFGVFCVTEIGKERGNQYELEGLKRDADDTNQKNDRLNWTIKMCRNPATIDNIPFFRMITDEQRANSLPADLRELMTIVTIAGDKRQGLSFPLFAAEGLFCDWFCEKFAGYYGARRFNRTDHTLGEYVLHGLAAWLHDYTMRIYNRYGYAQTQLILTNGADETDVQTLPYYLAPKKIYARRFATDFFGNFFAARALASGVGLDDYPEYASERADVVELAGQHSYMMQELQEADAETQAADMDAAEDAARRELIDELLRTRGDKVKDLRDASKFRADLLKRTYDDPDFLARLLELSGRQPPT